MTAPPPAPRQDRFATARLSWAAVHPAVASSPQRAPSTSLRNCSATVGGSACSTAWTSSTVIEPSMVTEVPRREELIVAADGLSATGSLRSGSRVGGWFMFLVEVL